MLGGELHRRQVLRVALHERVALWDSRRMRREL
jgi:hypothetical protein